MAHKASSRHLAEIAEFATFTSAEQRFIRRSLDVAFGRRDAATLWSRGPHEAGAIATQKRRYRMLDLIRPIIPYDLDKDAVEPCVGPLITLALFDLGEGKIASFAAFRFLYERLLGAAVRPWLPSVFCAAAALPNLHPELRTSLLQSFEGHDAIASGWSSFEPQFYPEWVEKVPLAVS